MKQQQQREMPLSVRTAYRTRIAKCKQQLLN
jgi:hypothetical protein